MRPLPPLPAQSSLHPNGWLVSYADMITLLLAMLVALTALGRDQTGIRFQHCAEAYQQHREAHGLEGARRPVQFDHASPHYIYEGPKDANATESGPADRAATPDRVVDGEQARFQQFLREIDRQVPVEKLPRTLGQVALDCFEPLHHAAPYLKPRHHQFIAQVLPLLRRERYQVAVVVWPATPSAAAWSRAARQAADLVEEIAAEARLDAAARARLLPLGQPWRHAGHERPKLTLLISKRE